MRVLAVSALADVSGGEVTLLRALPELQRRGTGVHLAVPASGLLRDAARARGIATVRIPLGPPDRRSAPAVLGAALAVAHAARCDVAWLNGLPTQRVVPALAIARRRAVVRVNNPLPATPAAWGRPGFWRTVAAIVTDSQASAGECLTAGAPPDRVHVLLPPAWGDEGQPPAAGAIGDGAQRVGFVGRIEPRKGVLELVRAARVFLAGRPGATLTIIGAPPPEADGDYARRVRDAVSASGVGDRIELRGYVVDAAAEIAHFDLLVVPSLAEPFGTVAAEAAAVGVPVVASRVDGLIEVVGEGGVLVEPGDEAALAQAVAALLDDPAQRRTLGMAARAGATRFAPGAYAERLEALLRDAAQ